MKAPPIYTERTGRGRFFISSPVGYMFAGLAFREEMLRHNYETRTDDEAATIIKQGLIPCTMGDSCLRCGFGRTAIERRMLPQGALLIAASVHAPEERYSGNYKPVRNHQKRGRASKTWQLQELRERALNKNL